MTPQPAPDLFSGVAAPHAKAQACFALGDRAGTLGYCIQAYRAFESLSAPPTLRSAYWLCLIGDVFESIASYAEAESCAERAIEVLDSLPSSGASAELLLIRSLALQGTALRQQGQYERALEPLTRAIAVAEASPDRPEQISNAWNNLGVLCKFAGWFERGEDAYRKALAAAERQERQREQTIATILHNIGEIEHARGRFDLAEEPARRAWEMRRTMAPEHDPAVLADANAYAAVLDGLHRYNESRPIYEHALRIYERIFGPEHYEVAATLHNLALLELAEGNRVLALDLGRRSFEIKRKLLGQAHPDTALSAMNLGSMLSATEPAAARMLFTEALTVFESTLAQDHSHIARCRQLLHDLR